MSAKKINDFLKHFPNSVVVYNQNPTKKVSPMVMCSVNDALKANESGSDVYFYINGGPKNADVKKYNACYIDMDAGRDSNGEYFDLKTVNRKKAAMLQRLHEFPLPATFVVETRNGFQVYWCFNRQETNNLVWQGVQNRLITFFQDVGADTKTNKPCQLYRVPFTFWHKKTEGKTKFACSITVSSKRKYSLTELQNTVAELGLKSYKATNGEMAVGTDNKVEASYTKKAPVKKMERPDTNQNDKAALIQEVIQFLNQVSGPLQFSKNQFLANCSKQLSSDLSDAFCIE
jgi:hypothetical protein